MPAVVQADAESKGEASAACGNLPLPKRFAQLIKISSALDLVINFFKVKNRASIYENIKKSVKSIAKLYYILESIAILTLV